MTAQLKEGAPPDSIFSCNTSGWMTIPDFNDWFDHFLKHTSPSSENPVLLLLDGHASHNKNLAFIEKARDNYVTVICFPPHCTHKLQPLDVAFMSPLKTNFSQEIEKHLKKDPGKTVTLNDISSLLGSAFFEISCAGYCYQWIQKGRNRTIQQVRIQRFRFRSFYGHGCSIG